MKFVWICNKKGVFKNSLGFFKTNFVFCQIFLALRSSQKNS